ncbi:MAG: hypothetical protein ACPGGG_03500 [Parvibaculales bacterium]
MPTGFDLAMIGIQQETGVDIGSLKQRFQNDLSQIRSRSLLVEAQKASRLRAVDRLTRAEAIAIAANLHELLDWLPGQHVDTAKRDNGTAITVTAAVTPSKYVSAAGLVFLEGELLSTDFDRLKKPVYARLDDFTGDAYRMDSRDMLVEAIFTHFRNAYLRNFEAAMTEGGDREDLLYGGEAEFDD